MRVRTVTDLPNLVLERAWCQNDEHENGPFELHLRRSNTKIILVAAAKMFGSYAPFWTTRRCRVVRMMR